MEDTRTWVGREAESPSGKQYVIQAGRQRATVVEVGGGVREYEVDGRPVLDPYPVDAIADGARGTPLLPWPNRLEDGRYVFDGEQYQVPLTEPEKGTAIHGLVRWRSWRTSVERLVRMATVSIRICHRSTGVIDDCVLRLEAATRIVTNERGLPTGREPVDSTAYDFRNGKELSDLRIDSAFTDLSRDADGRAGRRWQAMTVARSSSGSTAIIHTSRSSRATRSPRADGVADSAASR